MFSAMLFLDPATTQNGCLLVVPGSHKLGRQPHRTDGRTGIGFDQTFIDAKIMADVCRTHEIRPIVTGPGDLLLFHCNLMHASGHNLDAQSRRARSSPTTPARTVPRITSCCRW